MFTRPRIGFILVRVVSSGLIRDRRIHSDSPGFTPAHISASGSFAFAWFHSGGPRCLRVQLVSRGLIMARLGFGEFIRASVGPLGRTYVPSGPFWFARVRSRAANRLWVHPGSRRFTHVHRVIVGFIRVRVGSLVRS